MSRASAETVEVPGSPKDRLPHVMYVITRAHRGGAQSHVLDLLTLRSRARLTVVAGEEDFLLAEARARGVDTVVLPSLQVPISPLRDLRALLGLWTLIRSRRPALVHLHSSKAGLLGRVAAALCGVPAVFTAHGWAFTEGVSPRRRRLAHLLEKATAPLTRRAITVSEYDRQLAWREGVLPLERLTTVHNGLSPQAPAAVAGPVRSAGQPYRAIMVARFSSQKDQALLIRALASAPQVQLWLVGEGELLPDARALAEELGLGARVEFLGKRSDVPELLTQCDVFCLSSHYEGFPISILEAMRAGLPVVASDVGGVSEAVVPEETGLLVAPGDLEGWRVALQRLSADPAWGRKLGERGQQRFSGEFTASDMLGRIWQVYEEVWAEDERAGARRSARR